jgi:hypothetical protein
MTSHILKSILFSCFEDKPNMATLCCGNAYHFNCMSEWLNSQPAQRNSCPQCRSELPSLPDEARAPTPPDAHDEMDDSSSTTSTDSSTSDATMSDEEHENQSISESIVDVPTMSVIESDALEEDVPVPSNDMPMVCEHMDCFNSAARDCTNLCCGRCCGLHGSLACERHDL